MLLAALHAAQKVYGEQVVLESATLELRDGDRVALIGRNGAGKSTILGLLMGTVQPDGGRVHVPEGVTLAHLEQGPRFADEETVESVAAAAFVELDALEARLNALEAAGLDEPSRYEEWERVHTTFERRGGYARRARRDAVLSALGFSDRHDQAVAQLSGGERTRLGLAKLLMIQPDILLLDEPTNHLDIEMRTWLEGHLARYPGAALIVSHDRAFLDGATSRTVEVSRGQLYQGPGNPTQFKEAREEAERLLEAQRRNEERELGRLQDAADRMKKWAGQNAKLHRRAKAIQKRVDRFAGSMVDAREAAERTTRFSFDADDSGDIVLTAEHLTKSFGDRTLFRDVNLELRKGDRVGLVGRNGEGKSTLLKLLVGQLSSDDGRGVVRTGSRVRLGYYDQELKGVDPNKTLFEELHSRLGDVEAHNALGRFLFPYEAQFKLVSDLSGGERARLALLNLTLLRCNLLVLDEPTNHLDVEMIDALEDALGAYEGTLLFVSHDRRFLSNLAEQVWEVRGGSLAKYGGDWGYYQRKRREETEAKSAAAADTAREERRARERVSGGDPAPDAARQPSRWQRERRLEELEAEIHAAEAKLEALERRLADPSELAGAGGPLGGAPNGVSGDDPTPWRAPSLAELLAELGSKHAAAEDELLALMTEWDEITESLTG